MATVPLFPAVSVFKTSIMKKIYILLLLLCGAFLAARADYSEAYYSRMDGKKKEALKAAAKECVSRHQTLQYYDLPNYWIYSDVYPERVDGCLRWWEMYSNAVYLIQNGQSGKASFSANRMQREHAVPKSWWKKNGSVEYTPAYSDMWNLFPSDGAANQAKLNYPFGITNNPTYDNGVTKVGPSAAGYGGGCANVFEPADEYKGDFARAIFYMATVYDDINWVINYMFVRNSYPTLVDWAVNMLLQWSREDKVSQKEIVRNNAVEQSQGNRNPFVDFPELAEYIWGTRTTQTFYIKEQDDTPPTPPIDGDPEITEPVSGSALDFGKIAVDGSVTRALRISGKNLTEPLSVRVGGADRSAFMLESNTIPAYTMNTDGGYLLDITFLPTEKRKYQATLSLYDGGLDGSIAVTLTGEAVERPEFTAIHALPAENVDGNSYTARWEAPDGIVDYYILTRVRYPEGNEEAETYETGETSYTFTDRNPDVAESYTVSYSRLGLTSPASNTIYVSTGSGIGALEEAPFRVLPCEGGFLISSPEGCGGAFTLYDLAGATLLREESVTDGKYYTLPEGVYILLPDGRRPVKLIVR